MREEIFLGALKNSEFKHLVGEVDGMARPVPGNMNNVGDSTRKVVKQEPLNIHMQSEHIF